MTTLDGRFNHFWPMLKQRASAIYSLPAPAESAPASARLENGGTLLLARFTQV
jgi:hypothetical protein